MLRKEKETILNLVFTFNDKLLKTEDHKLFNSYEDSFY